jgi:hypothetical protein
MLSYCNAKALTLWPRTRQTACSPREHFLALLLVDCSTLKNKLAVQDALALENICIIIYLSSHPKGALGKK